MQKHSSVLRISSLAIALVTLFSFGLSGCTTTLPNQNSSPRVDRNKIASDADSALSKLYENAPSARQLVRRAKGVLVFPSVLQAGFVVGGEYGKGVLRVGDVNEEYLQLVAGSVGWQWGAQSKAVIMLFMTQEALDKFRNSNGWEVGANATVAVATVGANGDIDTHTIQQPIIGFVTTNAGLMAGISLQGAKISKINH
ncbi:MAG: YSC84-related protein [Pseudomonadota bacterium]